MKINGLWQKKSWQSGIIYIHSLLMIAKVVLAKKNKFCSLVKGRHFSGNHNVQKLRILIENHFKTQAPLFSSCIVWDLEH